ncbi:Cyclin-D1-2 [Nymphaea thermarum]|nr:Cyclin-D1-2 [Nymphaea thermarum]
MSFPDLLCTEDADFLDPNGFDFPVREPDLPGARDEEEEDESVVKMIELEGRYTPEIGFARRLRSHPLECSARLEATEWILEVETAGSFLGFRPLTVYLAVNYMDRFLSVHDFPTNGWTYELLSVACLSLAAKMEESGAPSLPVIQRAGLGRHFFEPDSLFRMEIVILSKLNWKLRSVTPFSFIELFARKVNPSQEHNGAIVSRGIQLILSIIRVVDFENFRPSSVAAAAVLLAAREIQKLGQIDTGTTASWYPGLDRVSITTSILRGL